MIHLHAVTDTVASRYARAEASFLRHHTGAAPDPLPPLRPLWHDILSGVGLFGVIVILARML